jgi:hypothetical protein
MLSDDISRSIFNAVFHESPTGQLITMATRSCVISEFESHRYIAVAYRAFAMYQGRFCATARSTRSRSNRHKHNRRALFYILPVPRCYKQVRRLELSSVREAVKRGLEPEAEKWPLLEPLPGNV